MVGVPLDLPLPALPQTHPSLQDLKTERPVASLIYHEHGGSLGRRIEKEYLHRREHSSTLYPGIHRGQTMQDIATPI